MRPYHAGGHWWGSRVIGFPQVVHLCMAIIVFICKGDYEGFAEDGEDVLRCTRPSTALMEGEMECILPGNR